MRIIYTPLIASVLLVACGAPESELEKLKEKKNIYTEQISTYKDSLLLVNEQIAQLDTTSEKFKYITVTSPRVGQFEHYFEIHGNVDADKNVLIYPSTPGAVKRILTSEGKKVKSGEVLAELDADVLISTIKEVKTQLELANDLFSRQKRLWDEKIGSEVQYLQAKTNKESLEQKIVSLNEQLQMSKIVAPFDGYIEEVFVKKGEMAAPQMPFLRLINTENVKINCDVSEDYIDKISRGNLVMVTVPGIQKEFEAQVAIKGEFINPHNRTFKCVIDLKNNDYQLKPNQLCQLRIRDFVAEDKVVLPENLVQEDRAGNQYVYSVSNNRVVKNIVTTGPSYHSETLILSGLNGMEKLILKGSRSVQENELVKVISQ